MNNELLLNELINIVTIEKNGFKCLDPIKYDALIEKVKIEIAAEENKDATTKGRINFINRYIDKMPDSRPILKYYDDTQFTGFKAFTDSYMMVLLNEKDAAGLQWKNVAEYIEKNPDAKYPELKRIVNFDFETLPNKIILKVNDILNDIKAAGKPKNKYFDAGIIYKYNNNDKIGFSSQLMKAFLTFMNCSSKDEITLYFKNNVTPAFMKNKNGSIGLILPIRLD